MLDHSITFQNKVERCQRAPAADHVILRDDLEPVHYRFLLEDVGVMGNPQTDADPVIREPVKSIGWHMFEKKGPAHAGDGPPGGLVIWLARAWSRRWRRRPFPCRSSCQTPSLIRHRCPCTSSIPCKRAFRYPFCPSCPPPAAPREGDEPVAGAAFTRAIVPPSKPVKAAASTREFLLIFIAFSPCVWILT